MTSSLNTESAAPGMDAIAVVGMAGRFPRARDVAEFWRNIREGIDCISFFSDQELTEAGVDPAAVAHPRYVQAKRALQYVDRFHAGLFGYTPTEPTARTPQHRL